MGVQQGDRYAGAVRRRLCGGARALTSWQSTRQAHSQERAACPPPSPGLSLPPRCRAPERLAALTVPKTSGAQAPEVTRCAVLDPRTSTSSAVGSGVPLTRAVCTVTVRADAARDSARGGAKFCLWELSGFFSPQISLIHIWATLGVQNLYILRAPCNMWINTIKGCLQLQKLIPCLF